MEQGWIKLYRELFEKAIWTQSTPEQKVILITLLSMANHKDKQWEWKGEKYTVKAGQFVTSIDSILNKCGKGITTQNIRTALTKFKKYGFLTEEVTKTGRLITIVNWRLYQDGILETNKETNNQVTKSQQTSNKEVTNDSQTANKQLTPNKNDKNNKNDNNDKNVENERIESPPLTDIEKTFLDCLGEIKFNTWIKPNKLIETETGITIQTQNEWSKEVLEKMLPNLELALKRKIEIVCEE